MKPSACRSTSGRMSRPSCSVAWTKPRRRCRRTRSSGAGPRRSRDARNERAVASLSAVKPTRFSPRSNRSSARDDQAAALRRRSGRGARGCRCVVRGTPPEPRPRLRGGNSRGAPSHCEPTADLAARAGRSGTPRRETVSCFDASPTPSCSSRSTRRFVSSLSRIPAASPASGAAGSERLSRACSRCLDGSGDGSSIDRLAPDGSGAPKFLGGGASDLRPSP